MSLVLFDLSNIFSIHFASNTKQSLDGTPIGAITGVLNLLSKFCLATSPSRVVCFYDGPGGSAKRRSIFKGYKENRKPRRVIARVLEFGTDKQAIENRDWQFATLLAILKTLPVQVIETSDYEADDGIGYVIRFKKRYGCAENEDAYVVSTDRDFLQLIGPNVSIYNPVMKATIGEENFLAKYEVDHRNWLFYRAICGDKSDNLSGVRGIGAKTLKKVLPIDKEEKLTLEAIEKLDSTNKTAKALQENKELIERNWKLMDLSNPLISLSIADKLDYQLMNFEPKLNKKDFILKASELSISGASLFSSFSSLLTGNKNDRTNV